METGIALWFLLGAVTWAVSVGIKIAFSGLLEFWILGTHGHVSKKFLALLQGLLSAFTELGAVALVFIYILSEGGLFHVVAFGAGAGIIEALILLGMTLFSKEEKPADLPWYQQWTFVIERFSALLGHIGSRGLVWLGISGPFYPFILAIIGFTAVDGVATYGVYKKWDWLEPKTWKRFYGFVTLVGITEIVLFLGLFFLK